MKMRLLAFVFLLWGRSLFGAVPVFDVATSATGSTVSSLTFSHTVTTNANRIIFCGCSYNDATDAITGITYNAVALAAVSARQTPGGSNQQDWLWVVAPATGANNIVVTLNGTVSWIHCTAYSFYNVHQTTSLGTPVKDAGIKVGAISVAASSATGELVVDFVCVFQVAATPVVGASQTQLFMHAPAGDSRNGGSSEAGATTTTMSWTWTGTEYAASMAVALKPAPDGTPYHYYQRMKQQ